MIDRGKTFTKSKPEEIEFGKDIARQLAMAVISFATSCKHEAFEDEDEVRLMLVNQKKDLDPFVKTRWRGWEKVPYVPSPFRACTPGFITEVIIGPAVVDNAAAEATVRSLLADYGISPYVGFSKIPYTAH